MITKEWVEGLEQERLDIQISVTSHDEANRVGLVSVMKRINVQRLRPWAWVWGGTRGVFPRIERGELVWEYKTFFGVPIIELPDLDPDKLYVIYGAGPLEMAQKAYVLPLIE